MKNYDITPEVRFQVLWEAGIRRTPSLMKYAKISRATAFRYTEQMVKEGVVERKAGSGGHNRISEKVERKVIKKVKSTKKPLTCKQIGASTGISKESARKIIRDSKWRFKRLRKKKLTPKQKTDREMFCALILSRLHDIPYILWTDETSSWLNKSRPRRAWVCTESIHKLKILIKKHWERVTPEMLQPYIDGMEQRFRDVLTRNGGYINK